MSSRLKRQRQEPIEDIVEKFSIHSQQLSFLVVLAPLLSSLSPISIYTMWAIVGWDEAIYVSHTFASYYYGYLDKFLPCLYFFLYLNHINSKLLQYSHKERVAFSTLRPSHSSGLENVVCLRAWRITFSQSCSLTHSFFPRTSRNIQINVLAMA